MTVPNKILILREEKYHTHNIGRYGNKNQFMGFVVATLPLPMPENWQEHKKWYAVLYLFDEDGNHIDTEYEFFGTTADGEEDVSTMANERLDKWLNELPNKPHGFKRQLRHKFI